MALFTVAAAAASVASAALIITERSLRKQVDEGESRARAATEQLEAARTALDETRARLDATQAERNAARDQLEAAQTELDAARAQVAGLQRELESTRAALDAAQAEVKELSGGDQMQKVLDDAAAFQRRAGEAEAELERVRETMAAQAESFEQRVAQAIAERKAEGARALETWERLQRQLRREDAKNRQLERDVANLWAKLNSEGLGPAALHLHAQIIELEGLLAVAAEERAAAVKAAEERAEEAETVGLAQLAQIDDLTEQVEGFDRERNDAAVQIEVHNRAKAHAENRVADLRRAHREETDSLREQRDLARQEAQEAKNARDVPEETRAELEQKDGRIAELDAQVARLEGELAQRDDEIEGWKRRQEGAQRAADEAKDAEREAKRELKERENELAQAERNLENRDAELGELRRAEPAWTPRLVEEPGDALAELGDGGIRDALEQVSDALAGVAIPGDALKHAHLLDAESRDGWRDKLVGALWALNEYAVDRGDFSGSFHDWSRRGMAKQHRVSAANIAMKDSETTASGKTTGKARRFAIDPMVNGDSWVQMEAHLKFGTGTPNAPRIYFYDDTRGNTGKVHVGFIGPHKLVPTSGGF